ncbi:MAG: signal peptidase I [Candidatus Marivariicella sp.]|nr:MAG: S26 family signal peptidase [Flavobacteriaceae bacterium TMED116]|tara:strand:+ start:7403 stop:9097 length:1695 start_codon:yes stop_codon:yes gene_type:complete
MNFNEWLFFILTIQIVHFVGTWRLYTLAGRKSWEALIPIYNAIILMKIIKKPTWWVVLLFFPVINILIFGIVWIETIRVFGKRSKIDSLIVILTLGFYIMFINYSKSTKYFVVINSNSTTEEWLSSMTFAIIAATIVHTYFIQPFIIPTGSLEKSLLIGDFLFVSKFHYGARLPTTAIAMPMVHDTIPLLKTRSYLKKPQIPFFRIPGFQKIKRNDIVVFNWPADTVRQFFVKETGVKKPIDKKSNYVKRCVGMPGDTLEIYNSEILINNKKSKMPEWARIQFTYNIYKKEGVSSRKLKEFGVDDFTRKFKINNITQNSLDKLIPYIMGTQGNSINNFSVITGNKGLPIKLISDLGLEVKELIGNSKIINTTIDQVNTLKKSNNFDSITRKINEIKTYNESYFPNRITFNWNQDNFGPIIIPKKGGKIILDNKTYPLYKKIIEEYENNSVIRKSNEFIINNKKVDNYYFKQNYYWMMGDNRHKSEDSRYWGFVPEDHIMGKPIFIWMSIDNFNDGITNWKIRWNRVFSKVNGEGKRVSYFPHFLVSIFVWQLIIYIRKKYKKSN